MPHALLSPSGSNKWLNCPPSARFELEYPDAETDFAKEGTLAHSLIEFKFKYLYGIITKERFKYFTENLIYKSPFYSDELETNTDAFVMFVLNNLTEIRKDCPDADLIIETRVNYSEYVPEGFGSLDAAICADGLLWIMDYKNGKGYKVEAEENPQTKLYGLGALLELGFLYDPKIIKATIFQPRLDNIETVEYTVENLLNWAEIEVKPKARLAWTGEGEYNAGKHCKFCRARADCRTKYEYEKRVLKYYGKQKLNPRELAEIVLQSADFTNWISAVKDTVLSEALKGKIFPGLKIVAGTARRELTPNAEKTLLKYINKEQLYKIEIRGIGEIEKALGKQKKILEKVTVKKVGKPTLVHESSSRTEFKTAKVLSEFKNLDDGK